MIIWIKLKFKVTELVKFWFKPLQRKKEGEVAIELIRRKELMLVNLEFEKQLIRSGSHILDPNYRLIAKRNNGSKAIIFAESELANCQAQCKKGPFPKTKM